MNPEGWSDDDIDPDEDNDEDCRPQDLLRLPQEDLPE
jgi:hypothetical protein